MMPLKTMPLKTHLVSGAKGGGRKKKHQKREKYKGKQAAHHRVQGVSGEVSGQGRGQAGQGAHTFSLD